jgi:hypothetical protein
MSDERLQKKGPDLGTVKNFADELARQREISKTTLESYSGYKPTWVDNFIDPTTGQIKSDELADHLIKSGKV